MRVDKIAGTDVVVEELEPSAALSLEDAGPAGLLSPLPVSSVPESPRNRVLGNFG